MARKTIKASDYVHLHNHTHHSLLDGLQKIPEMIEQTKKLSMGAIAVTDHGTLSGSLEFYKTALENNIKPIIGIETYVASRKHTDKDPSKDRGRFHLTLLAMNNKGYENLMSLSTIANLEGFYHKPRVDRDLLSKYNEGLICLSGCIGGELGEALRYGQMSQAKEIINWYKETFENRYYLEIQDHGHLWREQDKVNKQLIKLGEEFEVECVVTCDAHYLKHEDQEAHEILLCVQTGSFYDDADRMTLRDTPLHLTDPKQVIQRWKDYPELILNTKKIADLCNVEIEIGKIRIPTFETEKGKTERDQLVEDVYRGLAWRYGGLTKSKSKNISIADSKEILKDRQDVLKRADYELKVIENMDFCGYFLIVADFVEWAKNQGIFVGPGRGSGAGVIVAYALDITELDPLKYNLLFERFLNPDRISMPDIDIDIQDNRRDEVINYCVEKYGQKRVANIVTFGTMAARNAIRDVSRVLQVPYAEADRLAKMVPPPIQGRHIPLKKSIKDNKDLKSEYESNGVSKKVIDLAIKLEGTIRSHGVHAAGVVIAPDDLVKFVPLEMAQKGVITTQYPLNIIEDLGLVKMDFLGLKNLTIIKNTLRIINKVEDTKIDIQTMSLDDEQTYELLGRGDTTGVFQLESSGMKRYLKELKPTEFDDIIAMCALYRPGPLTAGLTDKFVKRKNGLEPVKYDHPAMKPSMESTYGVLVYQEQVMQFSKDVCGFTGGEADTLRKAIGKKKRDVMEKMKVKFIEGGVNHGGVPRGIMEKFWEDLMGFADYAFNKSHSACYAMIAYWTAYLKAHYPSAFMAALMTSDYDDTDRLAIEIGECKSMGLTVLPPDINQSFVEFAIVPGTNQIRFGLSAIKNVGLGAVELLTEERKKGSFKSLEDLLRRSSSKFLNRKTLESLIKTGALDRFGSRGDLLFNVDELLAYASKYQKDGTSGQIDLFGSSESAKSLSKIILKPNPEIMVEKDWLNWERELLGIYLSSHPLESYQEFLTNNTQEIKSINQSSEGKTVEIGGLVNSLRIINTRNNQKMAFVEISDISGSMEVIVFPGIYKDNSELWQKDKVLVVKGKINSKDRQGNSIGELKLLADEAYELTDEILKSQKSDSLSSLSKKHHQSRAKKQDTQNIKTKSVYMKIDSFDEDVLESIKEILQKYSGSDQAILVVSSKAQKKAIKLPFGVRSNQQLVHDLAKLLGNDCVAVR